MSAYKIKRWDAVTGDNILKRPMIYIEPDETFLSFVRANDFAVYCEISDTGMNYDSKQGNQLMIPGAVNRSAVVPNCRPNYYAETEYYVITLMAPWIGYPSKNMGQVKFFGTKAGMPTQIPPKKKEKKSPLQSPPSRPVRSETKGAGMSKQTKIGIGVSVGVLLLLLLVGIALHVHSQR